MKQLAISGLFTALIVVGAWISIPVGPVPFTLQVFFILLAAYLLGKKYGTLSVTTYVLLGAVGLPVFANFKGGVHILVGPTGGYLFGFIIGTFVIGFLSEKKENLFWYILSGIAGLGIIYTLGVFVLNFYVHDIKRAVQVGFVPFVWLDLTKLVLASLITIKLRKMGVLK
ncbi:biotin transporter BioY [Thermotoga sp. KOL6]|uniref:biotin transporter BioY n=1 Tax=Thermotoga sp. KOL6 TaxID=126741 RepID=UPI000C781DF8|nr:biotin transporter BioY [Thermotoga sp. KOL6]PLV59494.1 biotin transporter BioY [Thermotoga sp. KOL6]